MDTIATHSDRKSLREFFLLQPDVVFLNHGSFGACPRPVFEAYQRWQFALERQPVEFLGRRYSDLMRTAREALAAYLNADANDLVYVPNATAGLNIVARSLRLEAGDEVLSTDHEYGAMDRTWWFACRRRGARYVRQPVPLPIESLEQVVDAIWAGVTTQTQVLFVSHITSPTALIFPVVELVQRAREAGILTVIDGAHATGQIPLDLAALGADFYVGNCHKWLCAPKGSGFLHARREVQHLLEPLVVSWGWNPEERPGSPAEDYQAFAGMHEWQGTLDPAAYLAVPAAIRFQVEHEWPGVQLECHELLRKARLAISDLTDLPTIHPDAVEWYAQMAALPLPLCDAEILQRRLYDEFSIEVPIIDWNGRQFVRVSIQAYNTADDVKTLAAALATLLPEMVANG
jgi:isopenicillin-N epimerase